MIRTSNKELLFLGKKKLVLYCSTSFKKAEILELKKEVHDEKKAFMLLSLRSGHEPHFSPVSLPGLEHVFDSWLDSEMKKKVPQGPVASKLLKHAEVVLGQELKDPTMPYLWQSVAVSEKGLRKKSHAMDVSLPSFNDPAFSLADVFQHKSFSHLSPLKSGQIASVEGAFKNKFAKEVHGLISQEKNWFLAEKYEPNFFFHHMGLHNTPLLQTLNLMANNFWTKKFLSDLTGLNCYGPADAYISWFRKGDHALPHIDQGKNRILSLVWHLSLDWKAEWGGGLFWCPAMKMIKPEFNALHLFKMDQNSLHAVAPVAPIAQEKRFAVTFWFTEKR